MWLWLNVMSHSFTLVLPLFAAPSLTLLLRVAGLMLCLADTPARAAVVSSLLVLLRMVISGE